MEKQQSIADIEYANRKRKSRRDGFLDVMEDVILWDEWTG
jgi:IS5 family transposase